MTNSLGERIKTARESIGYSQRKIAEKLGVAYQTQNKYENGHRIPMANYLQLLSDITGIAPGWLLTGEGELFKQFRVKRKKTTIGGRVKNLRKSENTTQKIFAFRLGVPQKDIMAIEKNIQTPDADLIKKLIERYNVTEEWILSGKTPSDVEAELMPNINQLLSSDHAADIEKEFGVSVKYLLGKEPAGGRMAAHEETAPYGESETPDEKKYCGLLRRILRSKNKKRADIIKASIEEFAESEDRDFLKKVHQKKKAANDE